MKTRLTICALAAGLIFTCASAQDTIVSRQVPSRYHPYDFVEKFDTVGVSRSDQSSVRKVFHALRFYAEDTLKVYGIMVGITHLEAGHYWGYAYLDPSFDSIDEQYGLYVRDNSGTGLVPISEELVINPLNMLIRHYWDIQRYDLVAISCNEDTDDVWVEPIPIYESYFSAPVAVQGEYYLGYTIGSYEIGPYGMLTRWGFEPVGIIPYSRLMTPYNRWETENYYRFSDASTGRFSHTDMAWVTFPIIEPEPNYGDDSTLVVTPADPIGRLVRVSPNPATSQVRVYSSCGMERVEVYDPSARLVLQQACAESPAAIDVSAWPAGTYVAKVYTPLGVVSKKIIVK